MNQPWVYMCSPSWTSLPPPSRTHPSGSSQCTGTEHPVSCIEPGLAIYFIYGNIHVSMLFSQIIPPSTSPTESKILFFVYICVSFAVSHIGSFQMISSLHQLAKVLKLQNFSFSVSPSNEYSGLISFRIDCFDLLAVQGTLKSLLQHYGSKASILRCSAL